MARPTNITLCSFCGKSHAEVKKLIAGPGVYICDNCVILCKQVLDKELATQARKHKPRVNIAKPAEIKRQLDLHCVGQDHAKKTQKNKTPIIAFVFKPKTPPKNLNYYEDESSDSCADANQCKRRHHGEHDLPNNRK